MSASDSTTNGPDGVEPGTPATPTAADYLRTAQDSMSAARALAGVDGQALEPRAFLDLMARSDALVDHDGETCGHCYGQILGAQIAREMLQANDTDDAINRWAAENQRRWQESKFFLLWQKEEAAGRDPHAAFEERGWEP